jgi:protein-L-isoaspartate(D-aspartate) O-methyltransferase
MFDFAQARHFMVEGQLRTNEITSPGIVGAMVTLPRERFVPEAWATMAYSESEIPVSATRSLPTPMVLGKLLVAADIRENENVLHVGCTTGYGSAILSRLAASVTALEQDETLAEQARANLSAVGAGNVTVVTGPLVAGYAQSGTFDAILIEGSIEVLPETFAAQLKDNGRLVVVNGRGRTGQGTIFRRSGNEFGGFPMFDAAAPLLPGFERKAAFAF